MDVLQHVEGAQLHLPAHLGTLAAAQLLAHGAGDEPRVQHAQALPEPLELALRRLRCRALEVLAEVRHQPRRGDQRAGLPALLHLRRPRLRRRRPAAGPWGFQGSLLRADLPGHDLRDVDSREVHDAGPGEHAQELLQHGPLELLRAALGAQVPVAGAAVHDGLALRHVAAAAVAGAGLRLPGPALVAGRAPQGLRRPRHGLGLMLVADRDRLPLLPAGQHHRV
mmetsp:Transcript_43421/g.114821  ORF Transcript_43421/g.114821 Transcript_43421/m.114821 type:complete len:224 (+) Transcript_43421:845-1516(+)